MINVVIPSYKRSENLKGVDYFKGIAKWVVPESQKEDYLRVLSEDDLIIIKDEDDGSIIKKRNWILKNIKRPLIMIDDDVKNIKYIENRLNDGSDYKLLDKELFISWVEECFYLADELGCKLWGIYQLLDSRSVKEFEPLSMTKIILGPFQAHLEHDLIFDEKVGSKDDYDMSLQHFRKYKKVLRFNKFGYDCEHGVNTGGIVSYRTKEKEIEWCRNIMIKWGKKIIGYKIPPKNMKDLLNAKYVNVPIKGI